MSKRTTQDHAVHAVGHDLRRLMIPMFAAADPEEGLSPTEIAVELGEPLGNTSYHVRGLLAAEVIRLVRTVPRRGALQHYYQLTDKPQTRKALELLDVLDGRVNA